MTAIPHVTKLADAGNVEAQSLVAGMMFLLMDDTALPLVAKYASGAAGARGPAALRLLGFLYQNGRGVSVDEVRAEKLFAAAANAGDPYGAFNLAMSAGDRARRRLRDRPGAPGVRGAGAGPSAWNAGQARGLTG